MSAPFWSRRDLLKAMPGVALAASARRADLLTDWVPDEKVRQRVLVEHPATLYDFPKTS